MPLFVTNSRTSRVCTRGIALPDPHTNITTPPPHLPRGGRTRQRPLPSQSGLAVSIQRLSTPSPVLAGPADADNRLQVTGQAGQGVRLDHCCYPSPPISESLPHFQRAAHDRTEGHVTGLAFALSTKLVQETENYPLIANVLKGLVASSCCPGRWQNQVSIRKLGDL